MRSLKDYFEYILRLLLLRYPSWVLLKVPARDGSDYLGFVRESCFVFHMFQFLTW